MSDDADEDVEPSQDSVSTEEWQEIKKKFEKEGISAKTSSKQKALYLWRWLVDVENNLDTSRKMIDKLREQQSEEMKEVETYVDHIKHLSNERLASLEKENDRLSRESEELRDKSVDTIAEHVGKMVAQEGLNEIASAGLAEQVAYLLVLRSRLQEDLDAERNKNMKNSANLTDNLKLSTSKFQQMLEQQKQEFEEELKNERHLTKLVKEELKKAHDLEVADLRSRLQTAEKQIEELGARRFSASGSEEWEAEKEGGGGGRNGDVHSKYNNSESAKLKERLSQLEELTRRLQNAKRQLQLENETLSYKVSELLVELEEKEGQIRNERIRAGSGKIQSSPRKNSISDPCKKVAANAKDINTSAVQDTAWSRQIKKLQQDVENLQEQLLLVGGRHESLSVRYQQRKVEGRTKMQRIKDVFQVKQASLKDQIADLEDVVTVVKTTLSWEKECRQKIQTDFAGLQKEKADLIRRLSESEETLKSKSMDFQSVRVRVDHLETENTRICHEMALVKTLLLKQGFDNKISAQKRSEGDQMHGGKNAQKHALSADGAAQGHGRPAAKLEHLLRPRNKDQQEITV